MTNRIKIGLLALGAFVTMLSSSCKKVGEDHEINATWTFLEYQADSLITYDTLVYMKIEDSEKVTGEGPSRHFRGNVEIWKDGSIQFSNVCCGDTTESDSTLLPQVLFYSSMESMSSYEINGNRLTLNGGMGTMKFEK